MPFGTSSIVKVTRVSLFRQMGPVAAKHVKIFVFFVIFHERRYFIGNTIPTPMNLEELILKIQRQRLTDSTPALKGIAQAEMYLQQAYERRYIFELIQNLRDANFENESEGAVFIELTEKVLIISNTGAPFSERGINTYFLSEPPSKSNICVSNRIKVR